MIKDKYGLWMYDPFEFDEEYEYEKGENTLLYQLGDLIASGTLDKEYIVGKLEILPGEYADRALCYAEKTNPYMRDDVKEMDTMLSALYTARFREMVSANKLRQLTSFTQKDRLKYERFEKRIFDFTERIMIVQYLGYNVIEVSKYTGEDKVKKALSDILLSCDKKTDERCELLSRILEPMLEKVIMELQSVKEL